MKKLFHNLLSKVKKIPLPNLKKWREKFGDNIGDKTISKVFTRLKDLKTNIKKIGPGPNKVFSRDSKSLADRISELLDPEQFFKNIYSNDFRSHVHHTFLLGILATSTYSVGKIMATLIKGDDLFLASKGIPINITNPKKGADMVSSIKKGNLFNAVVSTASGDRPCPSNPQITQADPKCKATITKALCKKSTTKSSLPIKLVNTVVLQDSVKSLASIQVKNGNKALFVREGEKIQTYAKVGKITRLKVIFRNLKNDSCEHIENKKPMANLASNIKAKILSPREGKKAMDQNKPKGIKNEGNNFVICKSYMDRQMQNISSILSQAKANPFKNPDGSMSFKLSQVVPGSIYSSLNIKEGDVITHINGNKIKNVQEVLSLFNRISSVSNLSLGIKRDNEELVLDYSFDGKKDCEK